MPVFIIIVVYTRIFIISVFKVYIHYTQTWISCSNNGMCEMYKCYCLYIYMYVYMYICMYVYIYIYIIYLKPLQKPYEFPGLHLIIFIFVLIIFLILINSQTPWFLKTLQIIVHTSLMVNWKIKISFSFFNFFKLPSVIKNFFNMFNVIVFCQPYTNLVGYSL